MRIAVVHSFYRASAPSGENAVVRTLVAALGERGHTVRLVARQSPEHAGPIRKVRYAAAVGAGLGDDPTAELTAFHPEIVHVHNLFPGFGDRWLGRWPGPLVASLHNYRAICAKGILFRDGATCRDCVQESPWSGFRHRCYRDSRLATLPLTLSQLGGAASNRLLARADVVTVPSERAKAEFVAAGWPAADMRVLASGVAEEGPPGQLEASRSTWLASGRLVPEKGFLTLIDWWPEARSLDIIGEGPLAGRLRAAARGGIKVLPPLARQRYLATLADYSGFVFASEWPETQGLVVAEALAKGVPVVARSGSAGADLVSEIDPRWVYEDREGLGDAVGAVIADGEPARRRARAYYESHLTTDRWVARLEDLYREAISSVGSRW